PEEVEEDRKTNFGEGLERAHGLVNERRFEEARAILLELKGRIDNPQEIEAVENELEILKREEETTKEEEEKESFLMANKLIESEEYEKAITELAKLKESTTYSQESQQMIERAIDKFAGKKRQEAAKLFLMAKNTTDLMEKKGLLVRSLELLREVIEKYPANSYSEKITKNIETVKEEILKIDPQFSEKAPEPDAELER
ncbi:MAG: hypothetical protein ABID54_04315, partial [Pseudomonadota bacterium]